MEEAIGGQRRHPGARLRHLDQRQGEDPGIARRGGERRQAGGEGGTHPDQRQGSGDLEEGAAVHGQARQRGPARASSGAGSDAATDASIGRKSGTER